MDKIVDQSENHELGARIPFGSKFHRINPNILAKDFANFWATPL